MKKSIKKVSLAAVISILALILVWLYSFIAAPNDIIGFIILNFFMILPLVFLLCGIIIGLSGYKAVLFYPVVTTCGSVLVNYLSHGIFGLNTELWLLILFSLVPSLLGTSLGMLIFHFRNKKKSEQVHLN